MKLGICCNFTFPSVGGSEIVCKAIAEQMANTYGMDVTTFGHNVQKDFTHNKVKYTKCLKGNRFLEQINELDHLFIYSDSFWGFQTILDGLDSIRPTLSIALLGMYLMRDNPYLFNIFREERKHFKVITHSNSYQDYKKCFEEKIPVTVIPNGVDVGEFSGISVSFREKYGIDTDNMILNVSNYFYGKGQEHLISIGNILSMKRDDFTIVQLSNTVKYPYDKIFYKRTKDECDRRADFKYKFLRDIPREDVISAFIEADVSVLPSLKEVAPLVLLESQAAGTPWVSMDVGNADELWGGTSITNLDFDAKGYKIMTNEAVSQFAKNINMYLSDSRSYEEDTDVGIKQAYQIYNWDKVCEQYYNIFIG